MATTNSTKRDRGRIAGGYMAPAIVRYETFSAVRLRAGTVTLIGHLGPRCESITTIEVYSVDQRDHWTESFAGYVPQGELFATCARTLLQAASVAFRNERIAAMRAA